MSMSFKNKNKQQLTKEMNDLIANILKPANEEEAIRWEAEKITLGFMHEVEKLMVERGWTKKDLADKLGTSKSYVTQLFRADKLINVKLLAKLSMIFDKKFVIVPAEN